MQGYAFILLNDAFTAASNVYTKKNLGTEVKLHAFCTTAALSERRSRSSQQRNMSTRFSERTRPGAIIPLHVWPLCLSLGARETRPFVLQCINHHRPHRPGKCLHRGFTQGRDGSYRFIGQLSHHLSVSPLFEQVLEFTDWVKAPFVFSFLMSCFMGYVAIVCRELFCLHLNGDLEAILMSRVPVFQRCSMSLRFLLMYSIVLCSYYNSALTTTIVGALKVQSLVKTNARLTILTEISIFKGGTFPFQERCCGVHRNLCGRRLSVLVDQLHRPQRLVRTHTFLCETCRERKASLVQPW